jgi:ribose 5-phosphate isomerase B
MDRIGIASDHAGYRLKTEILSELRERGLDVEDLGTHDESSTDYPDYAHALAMGIETGRFKQGILVCGTGIGMAMTANRHPGVRAAVCSDSFSARMARAHNDANVLCLGGRVVGFGLAIDLVDAFLGASFEGGRHASRVKKIERAS